MNKENESKKPKIENRIYEEKKQKVTNKRNKQHEERIIQIEEEYQGFREDRKDVKNMSLLLVVILVFAKYMHKIVTNSSGFAEASVKPGLPQSIKEASNRSNSMILILPSTKQALPPHLISIDGDST